MTRMQVRALCLAFVVAVCATGATAEEIEAHDVVGAPVMLPKVAAAQPAVLLGEAQPDVQANIAELQKQNAEAMARIKALQDQESLHRKGSAAANESEQKREQAQAAAEEAENKKASQQEYLKNVEKKMQNADDATQIMQQIMELTESSQSQIKELRTKLGKATSGEAARGAAESEAAQEKAIYAAKEEGADLTQQIRELVLCKNCPGKAEHLSALQDKLSASRKQEEQAKEFQATVEAAAKRSVQKASNAKVKLLEDEKKAAAAKLDDLETVVETKSSEESTMGLHAVKLDNSKNEDVASAMVHEEAKVAMANREKSEKKLHEAKSGMIDVMERRIKKEDAAAEQKAEGVASAQTGKVTGKIESKITNLKSAYEAQKDSVEVESKKLKSLALTAAAHGDTMKLAQVQGKTAKMLASLHKTAKALAADKSALAEAQEWGLGELMDAKAEAMKKVKAEAEEAKKLATDETTPMLDQRVAAAQEEQKKAADVVTTAMAKIKNSLNVVAEVITTAAKTASVAEGESQKKKKEEAAKEQEAALKQKAAGVQSPQQAQMMSNKMEQIKKTLAEADDAERHAAVKAEHIAQVVADIAKQAVAPGNDVAFLANQMLSEITNRMREMTVQVSQASERGLSNSMVEKINMSMSSMKSQQESMNDALTRVKDADSKKEEAVRREKKAKFALTFRRAIEKVEKLQQKAVEQNKKVEKLRKSMLAIDHKVAAEVSKHWQKNMEDRISGPSVSELEKQKTELNVKIKLANEKTEEETETIDKINEAKSELTNTEAMYKKLLADLKAKQAEIDKMADNSAEKNQALQQMDELQKKELKVEAEMEEDKAKEKDADTLTPQLTAADQSIEKFNSRLTALEKQKGQLSALLQTREVAMKTSGDDAAKQKRNQDAVVKTKENLVKVSDDAKKYEHLKSIAQTEKAAVVRTLKKANAEMERESQEKLDTKNKWVKDMVHYAQVEKAMKKVGGEEAERHLKSLTKKNDEEEVSHKHETATKKEKQDKSEETKDKSEKRAKMNEKEKATKAKESEEKQEIDDKEKTHKAGIEGELKVKRATERQHKMDSAKERKEKGEAAAKTEEKQAKLLVQFSESFTISKENAEKFETTFVNAKEAELAGRTSSEVTKKAEIKKIQDDVANAPAANEAAMKDGEASLIKAAEAKETAAKTELANEKEKARDSFAAAKKEVATGMETRDKAESKEARAKAAEQAINQEIDEKDKMEKDKKESAQKSVESNTKREAIIKTTREEAVKKQSKQSKAFTAAAHQLKIAQSSLDSVQSRFNENSEKYEVFEKARASHVQDSALKELADAKHELKKDEFLFKNSETKEEEIHFGDQVQADRMILKVKQAIADRDGRQIKEEKAVKTSQLDKSSATTNQEKKTKSSTDLANANVEKAEKHEVNFKVGEKRLEKNQEQREKDLQTATEASELADSAVKGTTNEKSFKDAKATAKAASKRKSERKQKVGEAKTMMDTEGKAMEQSSKEGTVKEKTAKFEYDGQRSKEVTASNELNSEAIQKQGTRQNDASSRLLTAKSDASKKVLYFQKFEEKAMKNIQQAGNEKSFKKRVEEEKEEKKEISTAKAQGEREEKIGTDELTRKKDDKDLWTQLVEVRSKVEKRRQTAMELSNKAGDAARAQLKADKEERNMEEKKEKSKEKELKAIAATPGNNATVPVQEPEEKEKPEPKEPDQSNPDLARALKKDTGIQPTENPMVKDAGNFSSPYTALADTEKDNMRRRRSWHRRRRWEARRRAHPEPEKDKLARIQGKGPDAPTKRGFQGSFWSGVTGVRNVGDAIYKIEKLPPTKKETIDTIDYKSTPGYWIGLDDRFQNAFVARFRGHINVPTNGTYTFFCIADDGANVYINGKEVVKNDGLKAQDEEREGKVDLPSGLADVVVDYFCEQGSCGLRVDWEGPGMMRTKLSDKYVHSPKDEEDMEVSEQLMQGELESEEASETEIAQLSEEDDVELGSSDNIVSLNA
jgi:colicin import membrane protein